MNRTAGHSFFVRTRRAVLACMLMPALLALPVKAEGEGHVYQDEMTGAGFLGGRHLEIGVTPWGTLGAASTGADGQNWHGLIGERPADAVGLRFHPDGTWNRRTDSTCDFLLPGAVEEGFCIGCGLPLAQADSQGLDGMQELLCVYTSDRMGGVQIDAADAEGIRSGTRVRQEGNVLHADTDLYSPEGLHLFQQISFCEEDVYYRTAVTITNESDHPYEHFTYLRSFNPDQGCRWGEGNTRNRFLINSLGEDAAGDLLSGLLISAGTDPDIADPWTAADPFFWYVPFQTAYQLRPLMTASGTMHFHEARIAADKADNGGADDGIGFVLQFACLPPGESCSFTYWSGMAAVRSRVETIAGQAKRSGLALQYREEVLSGLEPDTCYTVAGAPDSIRKSDASGRLPLGGDGDLTGRRITIRDTNNSLDIPARPKPPAVPVLLSRSETRLILQAAEGCELSLDGGASWQAGDEGRTVFADLESGTEYAAVQRIAAAETSFASLPSEAAVFFTAERVKPAGGNRSSGPGSGAPRLYEVPKTGVR